MDDVKLNGRLTLGENIADNGGAKIAFMALEERAQEQRTQRKIDGFTPISGSSFPSDRSGARTQFRNDHVSSPRWIRILRGNIVSNGTVQNSEEFQKAFNCKAGQPMVSADELPALVVGFRLLIRCGGRTRSVLNRGAAGRIRVLNRGAAEKGSVLNRGAAGKIGARICAAAQRKT